MASSGKVLVPIILIVSVLSTIGVIYGALEMSDSQRSAFDVLKDLISGELTLKDIWDALTGKDGGDSCTGPDVNGVYAFDSAGYCVKKGCKPGYFEQGGICFQQQDLSGTDAGGTNADCEISDYLYGQCKDSVDGSVLTGDIGKCGPGVQSKTRIVTSTQIGTGGTCPNVTYVPCVEPCPLECSVPDELWVPDGDAPCIGGGKSLGVPINIGEGQTKTYHGTGIQAKKLMDIADIPMSLATNGGFETIQEYLNSVNYNMCTSPSGKSCKVEATEDSEPMTCPIPSNDIGWSWQGGGDGTVFTKESAEGLILGKNNFNELKTEPAVTREYAMKEENGILNADGSVNEGTMPMGYRIKFKASSEYSTSDLQDMGCSIFTLVPTQAPRTAEDATWVEDPSDTCFGVGCGQSKYRNVTWNQDLPAWGLGKTKNPDDFNQICFVNGIAQVSKNCCDVEYVGEWKKIESYKWGCEVVNGTMKRKFNRPGNFNEAEESLCGQPNEKYENDDDCNYIDGVVKVVLSSSFSKVTNSNHSDPYMLLNYIDSDGTTHSTPKINNSHTQTFNTPVKLTFVQGGLYYSGSPYNLYGAATADSVLDIKVYGENDVLFKTFYQIIPLGTRTFNTGRHYVTNKPGSEDWRNASDDVPLQYVP